MLVIAFIAIFIVGAITGLAVEWLFAMFSAHMSFDELGHCGAMLVKAGNNRESKLELTFNNGDKCGHEVITLRKNIFEKEGL